MKSVSRSRTHHYVSLVYVCLLALLLYVIVPQLSTFHSSLPLVRHAQAHWLVLAVAVSLGAHLAAGFKYVSLALRPLPVFPTVLVQLAGLLVNRLLPVGIGGIGINYLYLYKARHSKLQAGVVVTMNNLIGFAGHVLLVLGLLLTTDAAIGLRVSRATGWLALGLLAIAATVLVLVHNSFHKASRRLLASLKQYAAKPGKLGLGLCWSMVIAACYAACLYYSALALGVQLSFVQALVVLTLGVAAGAVSPTPGGLVGVEAALVGGLIAYKIPSAEALAVALLFRLITYWFALLLGALAFVWARKARYI